MVRPEGSAASCRRLPQTWPTAQGARHSWSAQRRRAASGVSASVPERPRPPTKPACGPGKPRGARRPLFTSNARLLLSARSSRRQQHAAAWPRFPRPRSWRKRCTCRCARRRCVASKGRRRAWWRASGAQTQKRTRRSQRGGAGLTSCGVRPVQWATFEAASYRRLHYLRVLPTTCLSPT